MRSPLRAEGVPRLAGSSSIDRLLLSSLRSTCEVESATMRAVSAATCHTERLPSWRTLAGAWAAGGALPGVVAPGGLAGVFGGNLESGGFMVL